MKLTGQWDNTYLGETTEEDEQALRIATLAAVTVVLAPLMLVGWKILEARQSL